MQLSPPAPRGHSSRRSEEPSSLPPLTIRARRAEVDWLDGRLPGHKPPTAEQRRSLIFSDKPPSTRTFVEEGPEPPSEAFTCHHDWQPAWLKFGTTPTGNYATSGGGYYCPRCRWYGKTHFEPTEEIDDRKVPCPVCKKLFAGNAGALLHAKEAHPSAVAEYFHPFPFVPQKRLKPVFRMCWTAPRDATEPLMIPKPVHWPHMSPDELAEPDPDEPHPLEPVDLDTYTQLQAAIVLAAALGLPEQVAKRDSKGRRRGTRRKLVKPSEKKIATMLGTTPQHVNATLKEIPTTEKDIRKLMKAKKLKIDDWCTEITKSTVKKGA